MIGLLGQPRKSNPPQDRPKEEQRAAVQVAEKRLGINRPKREIATDNDSKAKSTSEKEGAEDPAQNDDAAIAAPTATAGKYTIKLRKADGVVRMQKSIKMDPGKLFSKGNGQMVMQSSQASNNGPPLTTNQITQFGNGGGNASGSGFTSGGTSFSGRPFNPTLALAFDIEPAGGNRMARGKKPGSSNNRLNPGAGASGIIEISDKLVATGENGQKIEHQADNPIAMRCLEFECSVPGASTVYLEELQQSIEAGVFEGQTARNAGPSPRRRIQWYSEAKPEGGWRNIWH